MSVISEGDKLIILQSLSTTMNATPSDTKQHSITTILQLIIDNFLSIRDSSFFIDSLYMHQMFAAPAEGVKTVIHHIMNSPTNFDTKPEFANQIYTNNIKAVIDKFYNNDLLEHHGINNLACIRVFENCEVFQDSINDILTKK